MYSKYNNWNFCVNAAQKSCKVLFFGGVEGLFCFVLLLLFSCFCFRFASATSAIQRQKKLGSYLTDTLSSIVSQTASLPFQLCDSRQNTLSSIANQSASLTLAMQGNLVLNKICATAVMIW